LVGAFIKLLKPGFFTLIWLIKTLLAGSSDMNIKVSFNYFHCIFNNIADFITSTFYNMCVIRFIG